MKGKNIFRLWGDVAKSARRYRVRWLLPLVFMLLLLALILVLATMAGPLAPLIYPIL